MRKRELVAKVTELEAQMALLRAILVNEPDDDGSFTSGPMWKEWDGLNRLILNYVEMGMARERSRVDGNADVMKESINQVASRMPEVVDWRLRERLQQHFRPNPIIEPRYDMDAVDVKEAFTDQLIATFDNYRALMVGSDAMQEAVAFADRVVKARRAEDRKRLAAARKTATGTTTKTTTKKAATK